jgi:RNA polymerase sigma factor (sigma-70 family)
MRPSHQITLQSAATEFDRRGEGGRSFRLPTLYAPSAIGGSVDPPLLRLWREHEAAIEEIIAAVAGRRRLSPEDREDFSSEVKLRFFDEEKSPLLRHEGLASWKTYLTVVITNIGRDFLNKEWGKWRPSAAAGRLGRWAVRFEMLTHRDGVGLRAAVQSVVEESGGTLSESHVYELYAQLPLRKRREIIGLEPLGDLASTDAADAALWASEREADQRAAFDVLAEVLDELDPEEALMIRMRYFDGFTLARIGEEVGLRVQRVHERLGRILVRLRETLEERGANGSELLNG